MQISAVAAMTSDRVIGKDNKLLWHLPADLHYFKQVTMGKPILMGRKTHQSIGRPLPGRKNIILSRDPAFVAEGCTVVHSIAEALQQAEEIIVIGGAELYRQMLPYTQKIFLTIVHHPFAGDAYFPELNPPEWQEVSRVDHLADEKNPYPYSFLVFSRT